MPLVIKDSAARRDYTKSWATYLANFPTPDTLASSTWDVTPEGLTVGEDTNDDTTATVWVSGGEDGVTYQVVNHIVTEGTREEDWTLTVKIEDQ